MVGLISLRAGVTAQIVGTPNVALNSAATTGDATLSSNVITNVASTADFTVGDQIIVETKLNRGVVGCGGSWPALLYADEAALSADTTLLPAASNAGIVSYAGSLATGRTWMRMTNGTVLINTTNSSTSVTMTTDSTPNGTFMDKGMMINAAGIPAGTYVVSVSGNVPAKTLVLSAAATATATGVTVTTKFYSPTYALYYDMKILPKSMVAKISAKTSNTLTLVYPGGSTPFNAGASESGCNIYYDNKPILQAFATNSDYILPAGNFAESGSLAWNGSGGTFLNTSITGQGKGVGGTHIFMPRGVPNGGMAFFQCSGIDLADFSMTSNHGDNGYLFRSDTGNEIQTEGGGIQFQISNTCTAYRIKMTNFVGWTFHAGYSYRIIFDHCDQISENADQRYIQWQWEITNCSLFPGDTWSCRVVDCTGINTYLTAGPESFASVGAQFIRFYNQNGKWSINSASQTLIEDSINVIQAGCHRPDVLVPISHGAMMVFDINANISSTSGGTNTAAGTGCTITNPTVTIEGFPSATEKYMYFASISSAHDVLITGTVSTTVAANPSEKGIITGPWQPTGEIIDTLYGPVINCNGMRLKVQGIWIKSADIGDGSAQSANALGIADYGNYGSTMTETINSSYTGPINIAALAGFDGAGKIQIDSEKMSYDLGPRSTTLGTNINSSYTGNVTVGSTANFLARSTIKIGTEYINYTVVDATTINLTLRGAIGSPTASHAISDAITGLTETVHITARGVNSTTPATHATQTTTLSTTINSSYLGNVTVGSTTGLGAYIKIGLEIMWCSIVNSTTLTILQRAMFSSVAAAHNSSDAISNTAAVTYLNTPIVIGNVVDNIVMTAVLQTSSPPANKTNAQKLAL